MSIAGESRETRQCALSEIFVTLKLRVIEMHDQEIRDIHYRLLAMVKTLPSGKQEIRDPSHNLLGTYDPEKNETRD